MNNEQIGELLQLCAEICAPMMWAEKEYVLEHICGKQLAHYPVAEERHSVRLLKEKYEQIPELRSLCAAVMRYRAEHDELHYQTGIRSSCAARYALVQGNGPAFSRAMADYASNTACLAPSPELVNAAFWDAVLGEEWADCTCVPSAAARREIMILAAQRYGLCSSPGFSMELLHKVAPDLMVAYAMLRMDNSFSLIPPNSLPPAVQELAQAYWSLRIGRWEPAFKKIKAYLDEQKSPRNNKKAPGNGLLALIAYIVAIRLGRPVREVHEFRDMAAELTLRVLPAADEEHHREVADFFEMLDVWDAARNRNIIKPRLPESRGALPLVAMALGVRALAERTRFVLPHETLVAAVHDVEARGLGMLAAYAASALMEGVDLAEGLRRELSAVLQRYKMFAPFYELSDQTDAAAEGKHRLCLLLESCRAPKEKWLYWDLKLDDDMMLCSITPRLVMNRPQSAGTVLSLQQVMDATLVENQDEQDVAMVGLAHLLAERRHRKEILPLVADVLARHPRLRLVEGAYRRLVTVRRIRPYIRAEQQGREMLVTLDARQFLRFRREDKAVLSLPGYAPNMQVVIDYLAGGEVRLDTRRESEVRWLVATLMRDFDVLGDVPLKYCRCTPSQCDMLLRVSPDSRGGYQFELLVKHLDEWDELSVPGQGEEVLLGTAAQHSVCVQRDLPREICAAKALIQRSPVLHDVQVGESYSWHMGAGEQLLRLLHELRKSVPLHWDAPQGEPVFLDSAAENPLQLSLIKEREGWLVVGAQMTVDEGKVLALTELLESYRNRMGVFLPLPENRYLVASPRLMSQLDMLDTTLQREGRGYKLPTAAIPALTTGWQGALPEFLRLRENQLHECESEPPPAGLQACLREYQLQGFRWMLARVRAGLGACLADDMGLGKTVQLLALLLHRCADGPSLVLAPLSLCENWLAEAARFAPSLHMLSYAEHLRDAEVPLGAGDVVVASYGQMAAGEQFFRKVRWNIVALDEAQAIKNPDSKRAKKVCSLRAAARVCLTGTPVENELLDLWSIMNFLNPYLLGARTRFNAVYRNHPRALQRLVAPLVLRRTKQEVLPQLPPITEIEIGVQLSEEERALYESIRRQAVERVQAGAGAAALLVELLRLRRLCCHGKLVLDSFVGESSKLKAMVELVDHLQEAGHRALVFSQFTDVLDLAQEALHKRGYSTLRLDGQLRSAARKQVVKAFQEGEGQVFLISLRAGGFGLNLTAADYVILLDPWWNPAVEAQAAGRSHRLGQKKPVTVCRLIARQTVEERVMLMHETKQELADSVISCGSVSLEALRDILLRD